MIYKLKWYIAAARWLWKNRTWKSTRREWEDGRQFDKAKRGV